MYVCLRLSVRFWVCYHHILASYGVDVPAGDDADVSVNDNDDEETKTMEDRKNVIMKEERVLGKGMFKTVAFTKWTADKKRNEPRDDDNDSNIPFS